MWLNPFPGPGPRERVSGKDGGIAPAWSADGREIYFLNDLYENRIMSRGVEVGPPLRMTLPRVAFALPFRFQHDDPGDFKQFAVAPEGDRIITVRKDDRTPLAYDTFTVISQWQQVVRAKLGRVK